MLPKPLAAFFACAMLGNASVLADDVGREGQPGTTKNEPPLPAGKAAGIEKAQADDDTTLYIVGGVILVGGVIALLLANNGHHSGASPNSVASTH
jgi:hypothetical protein